MRRWTEDRRARRVDVAWPCKVEFDGGTFDAAVADVQHGGMAVVTCAPVEPSTVVVVSVELPDGTRAKANLQATWARSCVDAARTGWLPGFGGRLVGEVPEVLQRAIGKALRASEPAFIDDCDGDCLGEEEVEVEVDS